MTSFLMKDKSFVLHWSYAPCHDFKAKVDKSVLQQENGSLSTRIKIRFAEQKLEDKNATGPKKRSVSQILEVDEI